MSEVVVLHFNHQVATITSFTTISFSSSFNKQQEAVRTGRTILNNKYQNHFNQFYLGLWIYSNSSGSTRSTKYNFPFLQIHTKKNKKQKLNSDFNSFSLLTQTVLSFKKEVITCWSTGRVQDYWLDRKDLLTFSNKATWGTTSVPPWERSKCTRAHWRTFFSEVWLSSFSNVCCLSWHDAPVF